MKITPINQQMNTNRMNQNASANRSNTTNMQSPSFGTTIEPNDFKKIIFWLKACSLEFVQKHAKGLDKRIKLLKKDGHADVIKLREGTTEFGYYSHVDECSYTDHKQPNFKPVLHVQTKDGRKLSKSFGLYIGNEDVKIFGKGIEQEQNLAADNPQFGKFLDVLTPERIAKYRASAISKADKSQAGRAKAKRTARANAGQETREEVAKTKILGKLEQLVPKSKTKRSQ